MEITAITRNVRLSAQKGRPLAREVQGLPVAEALKVMRIPEEYWDACFLAAGVPAVKE